MLAEVFNPSPLTALRGWSGTHLGGIVLILILRVRRPVITQHRLVFIKAEVLVESTTGRVGPLASTSHVSFMPSSSAMRRAFWFQSGKKHVDPSRSHSSHRPMNPLFHPGMRFRTAPDRRFIPYVAE